jgi:hypothetical protein
MTIMQNIATFISLKSWINKDSSTVPTPTQDSIPLWYKEADRFAKDPSGKYFSASKDVCPYPKEGTTNDYGKVPTWKACPAIMDGFATGYVIKTPCDLKFFKDKNGIIDVEISDPRYIHFCTRRPPMPQFEHPLGFYKTHFAWMADWGLKLPEGYSALFMTPMNRFDLPFINTTGIVDSDKLHMLGSFPFFIAEGWEGTIPAGTPYMQILPFKREDWGHDLEFLNDQQIYFKYTETQKVYRQPDGGVYKNTIWSRRKYE